MYLTTDYPTGTSGSCSASSGYLYCEAGGFYDNYYAPIASPSPPAWQLTVSAQDTTGQSITGYYTVLFQNGGVVGTGFSPATFTLDSGQTYTVQMDNYGSCQFDHWANGEHERVQTRIDNKQYPDHSSL